MNTSARVALRTDLERAIRDDIAQMGVQRIVRSGMHSQVFGRKKCKRATVVMTVILKKREPDLVMLAHRTVLVTVDLPSNDMYDLNFSVA